MIRKQRSSISCLGWVRSVGHRGGVFLTTRPRSFDPALCGMAAPVKFKTDVKLVILGPNGVGKTCLLQRYLTREFGLYVVTIGLSLNEKKWGDWNVELWDTPAKQSALLIANILRGTSVAILAFDLTDAESYKTLQDIFIPLLQDSIDNCLTVVVGTKVDLIDEEKKKREVESSEAVNLAFLQHKLHLERALKHSPNTFLKDIDGSKLYYETSAKTGKGVDQLFADIQCMLLDNLVNGKKKKKGKGVKKVINLEDQGNGSGDPDKKRCC